MVTKRFFEREGGLTIGPESATEIREAILLQFDIDCLVHFEGSELHLDPFDPAVTARDSINKAYFISAGGDDTVYAIDKDDPTAKWSPLKRDDRRIADRMNNLEPEDRDAVLGKPLDIDPRSDT